MYLSEPVSTELARIDDRQRELFPTTSAEVAARLGLPPSALQRLFEAELLSFDPLQTCALDPSQQAELTFLGTLYGRLGGELAVLRGMVASLAPPYSFELSRLLWDWSSQRWEIKDERTPLSEEALEQLIEAIAQRRDPEALSAVADFAEAHGCSMETVRAWIATRQLVARAVGGR